MLAARGALWKPLVGDEQGIGDGGVRRSKCFSRRRLRVSSRKDLASDVVTLGNLCLDIVLNVESLPNACPLTKFQYMQELESSPPPESAWEAGGISNFSITAARLGLECISVGHIGDERFGNFLRRVLEDEGVGLAAVDDDFDGRTLLCWVLVDPDHNHAFCSRFDFNKTPVLSAVKTLPANAEALIRSSKAFHFNGFAFDELLPSVIVSAVECARDSGTAVFFDPGPRAASLLAQNGEALQQILRRSDVLLLTAEEATTLTGIEDPCESAQLLLDRGVDTKWVIVKLGGDGSLSVDSDGCKEVPGFKVDVIDTVGCGDSFAAAAVLGYNLGLPPTSTLVLANAVGAATAMGCGAGRNVATIENLQKLLLQRSDILDKLPFAKEAISKQHMSTSG